jgi:hypothetical protein
VGGSRVIGKLVVTTYEIPKGKNKPAQFYSGGIYFCEKLTTRKF